MLEVLVAFLLLSIGGVGLASMQLKAKRMSFEAVQRSVATSLARDIIERMRNNPDALANYVTNNLGDGSIATEPVPNCKSATCTITQMAAHDLWEWEQALDGASETITGTDGTSSVGGLAVPRGCITHNAGLITVAIAWKGFQSMISPTNSNCGSGMDLYGTSDSERQVVFISTFVSEL